jgi:CheY-like chemotaxis protein
MPDIKNVKILVIEDDPGHSRLIEKNLRRANILNDIVKIENGQEALDYLFSEGQYGKLEHTVPLLVLLDLNLPVVDGFHVLKRMKSNDATKRIPVIILTTSDSDRDIFRCYEFGCNVYLTKPIVCGDFANAIQKLGLFLSVASVPERGK